MIDGEAGGRLGSAPIFMGYTSVKTLKGRGHLCNVSCHTTY